MQNQQSERRIIIVGKTGNGKSSTGNSLLRRKAFEAEMSPNAVTNSCSVKMGTNLSNSIQYKVVDTPGFFDNEMNHSIRAIGVLDSLEQCKHPHVFLLVFSLQNRETPDERYTIDMLRIIFGEEIFNHSIVVFTHGGKIKTDIEFRNFWSINKFFVELIRRCGHRVTRIENGEDFYSHNAGRQSIVDMIETVSESGNRFYYYKYLSTHRKVIEKHCNTHHGESNVHDELSAIAKKLNKELGNAIFKEKLVVYAILGIAGATGLGVAYGAVVAGAAGVNALAGTGIGAVIVENSVPVGGVIVSTIWSIVSKGKFW